MKKLAVMFLAAVLAVSAVAPAFSATNPFMDVPMNHWAYDAIGQLAAHGILSGYPDGTYKGQQSTTRYEMASALARALAVVDMTKASKQDVEMLKRLVVEFKDELEALGVRVDELDERVAVLEDRLGGWHIEGSLVLDVINQSRNSAGDAFDGDGEGSVGFDEARLIFERNFGENDDYFFRARLRNDDTVHARFDRFFVEMPFFFDSKMTVGRFSWALEGDYKISLPGTGVWDGDQILTDWTFDGFGLTKNFGLGMARIAFAHPSRYTASTLTYDADGNITGWRTTALDTWMILAQASLQFTEQIGFDIGGQAYVGDNAEQFSVADVNGNLTRHGAGDLSFNNIWTIYGGLRFNFNDAIGIKGVFYHQNVDMEEVYVDGNNRLAWRDRGYFGGGAGMIDDANHWAVILDVKQAALKYTSLWLEYGQFDEGFWGNNGGILFYGDLLQQTFGGSRAYWDTKYYRVGLGQEWTDKFSTYLFYYGYVVEDAIGVYNGNGVFLRTEDVKPKEYGIGVSYKLNDYTTLGLNYMHADDDVGREDNVVKFRTKVTF
ncbi:MAG: S-layer homology domain-containing protein [Synergistaceae bacterium]|nr:S-layer homology domain-containing protein [Synergistaceae bacterium]